MTAATGTSTTWRPAAALALLAGPAYLLYGAIIQHLNGFPLVAPRFELGTVLVLVAVGELAALCVLGYRRGLRVAPGIAVLSLLVWPWVYIRVPFGGTDVLIPWVATLFVGSVELHRERPTLVDSPAGRRGLAVGTALFLAGIAIQTITRPYLLDVTTNFWWLGAPFVAIPALGLVWIGVTAVVLWRRFELAGPAAVVGCWLVWVAGAFAVNFARYPLTAFDGFGLITDPAADIRATWVIAALALIAVGSFEYALRRRRTSATVETQPGD